MDWFCCCGDVWFIASWLVLPPEYFVLAVVLYYYMGRGAIINNVTKVHFLCLYNLTFLPLFRNPIQMGVIATASPRIITKAHPITPGTRIYNVLMSERKVLNIQ